MRPRALLVAPIFPSRSGNGLAMRIALFAEAMEAVADLDILVVPIAGQAATVRSALRPDTTISIVEPTLDRTFDLLSRIPDAADRTAALARYGRPSLCRMLGSRTLDEIAAFTAGKRYDFVHVARSYMMPVTEVLDPTVPLGLDLDEDDRASVLSLSGLARRRGDVARADRLAFEAEALDRLVSRYTPRARMTFVSNRADRASLMARHEGLAPETVVNAIAIPRIVERRDDGRTLAFVGTLGFEPNLDGLMWFASQVLPRLRALTPHRVGMLIAGASPPPAIRALAARPGIELLGDFADVGAVYRRATVAIAPMRTGGGLRTKIVEAAAHGVACVTHRASHQGLPEGIGWVAGSAADFAGACAEALDDAGMRARYERAARRHVRSHYDRTRVVASLAAFMAGLVK